MTRADFALVTIAAALIAALYAMLWAPEQPAQQVEVRVAGEVIGVYPLEQPMLLKIQGARGISELRIDSGRARFTQGPCRNRICVHAGWLTHAGDSAACLPNRVSIHLLGDERDALDAISF